MKNRLFLIFLMQLGLLSCMSDDARLPIQVHEAERRVSFEFFTDKDYHSSQFDAYFVNLSVGISLKSKITGEEVKVLAENTGWMPFKDIPQVHDKIIYGKVMQVDPQQYSVSYGYSHQVRIGETIQMKAVVEFLKDWQTDQTIVIRF